MYIARNVQFSIQHLLVQSSVNDGGLNLLLRHFVYTSYGFVVYALAVDNKRMWVQDSRLLKHYVNERPKRVTYHSIYSWSE